MLTDSPYNVKIARNVSGLGKKKHGEFEMASGEMDSVEFFAFLTAAHKHCANHMMAGGVAYSFMDWRSVDVSAMARPRPRAASATTATLPSNDMLFSIQKQVYQRPPLSIESGRS